ncbi:response regulator [Streptomyces sp. NPDC059906]|uniref:response regulator n=1 Tax=Streptomyces sp. NPDC059906 TaxID=3346997 RepID=UPI003650EA35
MIRVAVVDDDRMLLEGLTSWLSGRAELRLVAAVATVDALLAALQNPALPNPALPNAALPDGGPPNTEPPNTALPNAALPDAGPPNPGLPNAGPPNPGLPNAGPPNPALPNAALPNAGPPNPALPNAGLPDGGLPKGPVVDVVLLDLLLKDGSEAVANIRRLRAAGSRVLIISTATDRAGVVEAVAAGADGYLTKDNDLDTLVEAVVTVAAGGTVHSPELAFAWAHHTGRLRPRLSPKELEVLRHYASGLTLKATARRVGISPHTAKHHLDRVKDKYRRAGRPAYTKIDLAVRVREDGLGSDDDRR